MYVINVCYQYQGNKICMLTMYVINEVVRLVGFNQE